MLYVDALRIAKYYLDIFHPVCRRIAIKGSVSRMKAEPKDIELLAIPDLTPPSIGRVEFGKPLPKVYKTKLDALVDEMVNADVMRKRSV